MTRGRRGWRARRQGDRGGPNFSRVLLVSDNRTNVAGLIETSRAIGDIHGNGERPLQMTNIPATDTVNLGETVVTAGIELETGIRSTYPKGLLIGTIVDVQRQPNQLFQTALVQPVAALDRLEYVLVIVDYAGGLPDLSPAPSGAPSPGPSSGTLDATYLSSQHGSDARDLSGYDAGAWLR